MKYFLALIFLSLSLTSYAQPQDFDYPTVKKSGTDAAAFVPEHWQIIKADTGDLNKDKKDDIVFVMEYIKGYPNIDDHHNKALPRVLVVLFQAEEGYSKALQHNKFIMNAAQGGTMGDPFSQLFIRRGVLNIEFMGGSRELWIYDYKFRFQDNDWYLIGHDDKTYDRLTGDYTETSQNYLTHKQKFTRGSEAKKTKPFVKWTDLEKKPLRKIHNMANYEEY